VSTHCTTGRRHVWVNDEGEAYTKSVALRWKSKKHPDATHRLQVMCQECGRKKVVEPDNLVRMESPAPRSEDGPIKAPTNGSEQ